MSSLPIPLTFAPSPLDHWRRQLGRARRFLFRDSLKRISRNQELRRLDAEAARLAEQLAPIPLAVEADAEFHFLCDHRSVTMSLWSIHSIAVQIGRPMAVHIHSDGSLTSADERRLANKFPNIRVIHEAETNALLDRHLPRKKYSNLRNFRQMSLMSRKLLDFHLSGSSRQIFMMDTDVLYFRRPDEFLGHLDRSKEQGRAPFVGFRDFMYAYVADEATLTERFRTFMPQLNAGMCLIPRFGPDDFLEIESLLVRYDPAWVPHHWGEQTMYAILAGRAEAHHLSDEYVIGRHDPTAVAVHYVGPCRELYYKMGIPQLWDQVRRAAS